MLVVAQKYIARSTHSHRHTQSCCRFSKNGLHQQQDRGRRNLCEKQVQCPSKPSPCHISADIQTGQRHCCSRQQSFDGASWVQSCDVSRENRRTVSRLWSHCIPHGRTAREGVHHSLCVPGPHDRGLEFREGREAVGGGSSGE